MNNKRCLHIFHAAPLFSRNHFTLSFSGHYGQDSKGENVIYTKQKYTTNEMRNDNVFDKSLQGLSNSRNPNTSVFKYSVSTPCGPNF